MTERVLECGFYERLEERLPGIVAVRFETFEPQPTLVAPDADGAPLYRVARDREEELLGVARDVKWRLAGEASPIRVDDHAVVVQRPLPYVYLARHTLEAAGLPWTASDSLPLAAEPYAAALGRALRMRAGGMHAAWPSWRCCGRLTSSSGAAMPRRVARRPAGWTRNWSGPATSVGSSGCGRCWRRASAEGEAAAAGSAAGALAAAARIALDVVDALEPLATPARISEHSRAMLALPRSLRTGRAPGRCRRWASVTCARGRPSGPR